MRNRKLGALGWDVSEIGYGGWGIGRTWWGPTDDTESINALKRAWELGVNFFDTAFVYGDGHSEKLMAQALAGKPALIATKIPPKNGIWPGSPKTPLKEVFPKEWIVSCTERSLKYLQRNTLDLTQFHVWSDAWLHQDEWKETIGQLKKSGKIRGFGVSINDHDPNSALELVASGLIDTVQVIFNIFDQSPMEKLFPLCLKHKVGVIVRVPFDEGSLTGAFNKNTRFEQGDFRASYFKGDSLIHTVERVEKLKSFLGPEAKTLSELALKFVLSQPAVSTVIPGMRKSKNVDSNVAVGEAPPLSAQTVQELKKHAWPRNFYTQWED
ncbi:MAG: Aldo-keto reductase IolS [Elusimicrobia bacterium]|nr:Aldo-keto reductase IolS [Elusimicrobiota bacterium]